MFASNVKQLESHLRDKGWLRMAYVYWFDEPGEKDYAFVEAGMDRHQEVRPRHPDHDHQVHLGAQVEGDDGHLVPANAQL